MKNSNRYKGVIVPMVTPIGADGTVDKLAVKRIVDSFIDNGVTPFIIGSTGEAPSLSREQRVDLVEATVEAVDKRDLVYVGVSGNCLADSIEEGLMFAELGADVLVATPTSYYPMTRMQMIAYFEQLADALPLPLIMYNMPGMTKHNIPVDVVERLSHHDNIVGLKDSERDEARMNELIELAKGRTDFVYLLGWAAMSVKALSQGASGIVPSTGNLTPELYKQLYDLTLEGNIKAAEKLQMITNEVSSFYQKDRVLSESIPALKALMSIKALCSPDVVPPMYRIDRDYEEAYISVMKKELSRLNLL